MAKKNNLFLLIKSLSKSEKRYFRIYAGMSGREANYIRLFDVIEEQKEYDEDQVRQKLKGERFLSQLHVTKIYLTELILKALRNYHSGISAHAKLLDLLKEIELLFGRELYDLCHYKIKKAEGLAARYEELSLLIAVLSWKRRLALAVSGNHRDINTLLDDEARGIDQMKGLNTYWKHAVNIGNIINNEDLLNEFTIPDTDTSYVLQSRILHAHISYSIHFIKGDLESAEHNITAMISLLEKFPERIQEDPNPYVTAIGNKIGLYLTAKRWVDIPVLIEKIREVPSKYHQKDESKFTVRLSLRIFNIELEMYRDSRQLEKGIMLIQEITRFLDQHRKAIPEDYILLFYYQFANIFFLNKEFKKSLHWVNKIIHSTFGPVREDIQAYARILNLVIHFELDNIIVLRYAVDSCRRYLKKTKLVISQDKEILQLFSKLSHAYPDEYRAIFEKALAGMFSANSSQDYLDIKGWLEEKLKS